MTQAERNRARGAVAQLQQYFTRDEIARIAAGESPREVLRTSRIPCAEGECHLTMRRGRVSKRSGGSWPRRRLPHGAPLTWNRYGIVLVSVRSKRMDLPPHLALLRGSQRRFGNCPTTRPTNRRRMSWQVRPRFALMLRCARLMATVCTGSRLRLSPSWPIRHRLTRSACGVVLVLARWRSVSRWLASVRASGIGHFLAAGRRIGADRSPAASGSGGLGLNAGAQGMLSGKHRSRRCRSQSK